MSSLCGIREKRAGTPPCNCVPASAKQKIWAGNGAICATPRKQQYYSHNSCDLQNGWAGSEMICCWRAVLSNQEVQLLQGPSSNHSAIAVCNRNLRPEINFFQPMIFLWRTGSPQATYSDRGAEKAHSWAFSFTSGKLGWGFLRARAWSFDPGHFWCAALHHAQRAMSSGHFLSLYSLRKHTVKQKRGWVSSIPQLEIIKQVCNNCDKPLGVPPAVCLLHSEETGTLHICILLWNAEMFFLV